MGSTLGTGMTIGVRYSCCNILLLRLSYAMISLPSHHTLWFMRHLRGWSVNVCIIDCQAGTINWHLSYRPHELFVCYVRSSCSVLCWIRLLTKFTVRLNTRNYVRNRSTKVNHNKAYNSFNLSSTRIGPQSGASGPESRQPAVFTITLHRSTITDCARSNPDHPDFEDPKPVRHLSILETPRLILFYKGDGEL